MLFSKDHPIGAVLSAKELWDIFQNMRGALQQGSQKSGSSSSGEQAEIGGKLSKKDESIFEQLHIMLNEADYDELAQFFRLFARHQADDIRLWIVNMEQPQPSATRVVVSENRNGNKRYERVYKDYRYTTKDVRYQYLMFLASLIRRKSPEEVKQMLIDKHLIREKTTQQEVTDAAKKAREEAVESVYRLGLKRNLGTKEFSTILQVYLDKGLTEEEAWNIETFRDALTNRAIELHQENDDSEEAETTFLESATDNAKKAFKWLIK